MRSWLPYILVIAACGGGGRDNECVPGASVACACSNGAMGAQICDDAGGLGVCSCDAQSSSNSPTAPAPPPTSPPTTTPPPTSDPGGPMVLSFSASSSTLTQGQSITFSAIVTTPAGTDALAGGTLATPDGAGTYGPFDAGTQKGAFSLVLSWAQMNQTLPIDFVAADTRIFQAVFFDTSGRRATASVAVALSCSGQPACSGTCVKASEEAPQECGIQVIPSSKAVSCNTVCAAFGLACIPYCHLAVSYMDPTFNPLLAGLADYGSDGLSDVFDSCADVPPASETDTDTKQSYPFASLECCCH